MTPELKQEIFNRRHHNQSIGRIAKDLGIWPFSVRWVLKQGLYLEKARQKRKEDGKADYRCSACGETGHNVRTHGVKR